MYSILPYLGPNIANILPVSAYPDTLHTKEVSLLLNRDATYHRLINHRSLNDRHPNSDRFSLRFNIDKEKELPPFNIFDTFTGFLRESWHHNSLEHSSSLAGTVTIKFSQKS